VPFEAALAFPADETNRFGFPPKPKKRVKRPRGASWQDLHGPRYVGSYQ